MCWSKSCASRVSFRDVIFGSGLGSQAGEARARRNEQLSPAERMTSHAFSVPLFRFIGGCSGARYESTLGTWWVVIADVWQWGGQPANFRDDYYKRPSSPTLSFGAACHTPSKDACSLHSAAQRQFPRVGCVTGTWLCHNSERLFEPVMELSMTSCVSSMLDLVE